MKANADVVLILSAHPDDEVLGCGGTIARHAKRGDSVDIVFMADGVASRPGHSEEELRTRNQAAEKARTILGASKIHFLKLPDNKMDSLPLLDIVQPLEALIKTVKPEIIYTHHLGDLNVDHRLTHQAVMTACRPQPAFCVKEIYSFEVMSSTEWQTPGYMPFTPNVFVDISDFLSVKEEALKAYETEMRNAPHSRSIENLVNLAKYRGASVGVTAAEAFVLIRKSSF